MAIDPSKACPYCGHFHGDLCPQVKAYEYDHEGRLKRVEFFAPNDHIHPEVLEAARRIAESKK
jgi:hypothetical protein